MGFLKKWIRGDEDDDIFSNDGSGDEYYKISTEASLKENDGNSKMVLLEPRAYSESQQIADHLKSRDTVVINLKRVTPEQAKRIVDFVSGVIYAIGGNLQKIGGGIFLCAPNNVNVLGSITDETGNKDKHDNDDLDVEIEI